MLITLLLFTVGLVATVVLLLAGLWLRTWRAHQPPAPDDLDDDTTEPPHHTQHREAHHDAP